MSEPVPERVARVPVEVRQQLRELAIDPAPPASARLDALAAGADGAEWNGELTALREAAAVHDELEAFEPSLDVDALVDLGERIERLHGRVGCFQSLRDRWSSKLQNYRDEFRARLIARAADVRLRSSVEIHIERSGFWTEIYRLELEVDAEISQALFALREEERSAAELEAIQAARETLEVESLERLTQIVRGLREPYRTLAENVTAELAHRLDIGWGHVAPGSGWWSHRGQEIPTRVTDAVTGMRFVLVTGDGEPFYLAETVATIAQWRRFAAETGHRTLAERDGRSYTLGLDSGEWDEIEGADWSNPTPAQYVDVDDNWPAVHLTWHDAVAFCEHYGLRLPTEAEWDRACRAGTSTAFWWGDDAEGAQGRGNFRDRSLQRVAPEWSVSEVDSGFPLLAPVGASDVNPIGVYDALGNVWEWCSDADDTGDQRKVLRGGSWNTKPDGCLQRRTALSDYHIDDVGFRPARDVGRITRPGPRIDPTPWLWLVLAAAVTAGVIWVLSATRASGA